MRTICGPWNTASASSSAAVERGDAGWTERDLGHGEELSLAQPTANIAVDDLYLYAGITLEPS
jgi:hypothetical protein